MSPHKEKRLPNSSVFTPIDSAQQSKKNETFLTFVKSVPC